MSSISPVLVSPPPALAASRARRQRSNAISRARESEAEWDFSSTAADTSSSSSSDPTPWRDDELICPLAPDTQQHPKNVHASARAAAAPVHVWPANEDELQAVLAQFAFPGLASSSSSGRKHRRSGEIVVVDPSPPSCSAAAVGGGKRRCTSGPSRRVWCAHCERGRSSA